MGIVPAKARIAATETPASFGVQGPGETTMCVGCHAAISGTVTASLR